MQIINMDNFSCMFVIILYRLNANMNGRFTQNPSKHHCGWCLFCGYCRYPLPFCWIDGKTSFHSFSILSLKEMSREWATAGLIECGTVQHSSIFVQQTLDRRLSLLKILYKSNFHLIITWPYLPHQFAN